MTVFNCDFLTLTQLCFILLCPSESWSGGNDLLVHENSRGVYSRVALIFPAVRSAYGRKNRFTTARKYAPQPVHSPPGRNASAFYQTHEICIILKLRA
ncbi:hypothetical protein V8E53_013891 [Lactarius tabidus]